MGTGGRRGLGTDFGNPEPTPCPLSNAVLPSLYFVLGSYSSVTTFPSRQGAMQIVRDPMVSDTAVTVSTAFHWHSPAGRLDTDPALFDQPAAWEPAWEYSPSLFLLLAGHSRTCRVIYIIIRGCRGMLIGIAPGTCGPGRAQHARASVYTVPPRSSSLRGVSAFGWPITTLSVSQSYEYDRTTEQPGQVRSSSTTSPNKPASEL